MLSCPTCSGNDIHLEAALADGRKKVKCGDCGAMWLQGKPVVPPPTRTSAVHSARRRFPTPSMVESGAAARADRMKAEFLKRQPQQDADVAPYWEKYGFAFDLLMAVGYRSSEVTLRPRRFSGPMVRAFASAIAATPDEWRRQVERASEQNLVVTVYADNELVVSPRDLPELDFRQIEIECVGRSGRSFEERRAATGSAARAAVSLLFVGLEIQATDLDEDLTEGAVVRVEVNKYERNPVARMQCIAHYGSSCWVCDLSFSDLYGELGTGYIHVHHRVLVSTYAGKEYVVDPVRDLIPLCPNCHMMLHRRRPPLEPAELRSIMGKGPKPALPVLP